MTHSFPPRRSCDLQAQQFARFVVGLGGGGDDDVHATHLLDLVVADLWEDDLLLETHRVVAATVERLGVQATEVADARHREDRKSTRLNSSHSCATRMPPYA